MMSDEDETDWHETEESVDAGKHGKDYEIEISKFLFKRLIDNNFKNFKFTREKKGVGKFDDLIYIYDNENGQKKYGLVQLKHILNDNRKITYDLLTKNKNSYFLLSKYFSYYNDSLNSLSSDKDFCEAELEALIFCTNIGLEDDLQEIRKQKIANNGLFKNCGVLYNLEMSDEVKRQVFTECYQTEREKLADELMYYIMLNKHIDINCLKKDDHVSMLKTYHVPLAKHVLDVTRKTFKSQFMEVNESNNPELFMFRKNFFQSIVKFYDRYKDLTISELQNELKIKSKASEELKKRLSDYESSINVEDFLFNQTINVKSSFGDELANPDDLKKLPTADFDAEEINKKIDNFLKLLIFATKECDNENVIRNEMSPEIFLKYNDKMNQWYHGGSYKEDKDSILKKRKWLAKKKLLSEAMKNTVKFQGKEVKLSQLAQNLHLNPDILMRVFCGREIVIGQQFSGLEEIKKYYISRVLRRQRTLNKNILKTNENDIFLISNINDTPSQQAITHYLPRAQMLTDFNNFDGKSRFVILPENFQEESFRSFTNKLPSKNIHWLEYNKEELIWQQTHGTLSDVHNYFYNDHETSETFSESCLHDTKQFLIINGEPGMGKSTLLSKIEENLSKEDSKNPNWIIKIALKDCAHLLEKNINYNDVECIIKFLAEFQNVEDPFSTELLKHFMLEEKRLIILFDGFDELGSDEQQKKMIDLLEFLKSKSKVKQVWITTRPHFRETLENRFGVVAYDINEINEDEQIIFLSKYWQYNSKQSEEKMLTCAKNLIKNFNANISNREGCFLGVPLQTYMLAVVFLNEIMKEDPIIPESLLIASLIEKFLDTKYDIYFRKLGESISLKNKRQQLLRKLLDDVHQDFALQYGGFLSPNEMELFDQRNHTFEDDELLDIGIIYKIKEEFHFLHKMFSDYLTAKRFVEVSLKQSRYKTECIDALKRVLLKPENEFLLYLFDLKLTENCTLLNSVLNGNEAKLNHFDKDKLNEKDCFGRNIWYYAIQYRQENIINILIENEIELDITNDFFIGSVSSFVEYYYKSIASFRNSPKEKNSSSGISLGVKHSNSHNTYTNLATHIFTNNNMKNFPKLRDIYKFYIEIQLRNWTVVELLVKSGCETGSIKSVISMLRNEVPLDTVLVLMNRIRKDEIRKSKVHADFYTDFIYAAEYILERSADEVTYLANEFTEEGSDLIEKFNIQLSNFLKNLQSFGINCRLSDFAKYMPLILLKDAYYDLSSISSADLLSMLVSKTITRANNFTIVVKTLLSYKAQSCELSLLSEEQFLKNEYYDILERELLPSVDLSISYKDLKEKIDCHSMNPSSNMNQLIDTWNVIEEYKEKVKFDSGDLLKKVVCQIMIFILNSGDAWELVKELRQFHHAIEVNDIKNVERCLQVADTKGWTDAFLNACNDSFEVAANIAKRSGCNALFVLISTQSLD